MDKYTKNELENLIIEQNKSYNSIGKMFGVTGAAIKKAAKRFGIAIPKRRKINEKENFSHPRFCKNSLVNRVSDDDFKQIILSSASWKEIGKKLGYSNIPSSNIKDKIIERCSKLGIKPILSIPSPILSKTKEELLNDRKNYQSYRSSIRKLAERAYKSSGKPYCCAKCDYSNHVEVAHIKAVSDFDDSVTIAEINSIDNLIALCPNHHWEYDHGILKL